MSHVTNVLLCCSLLEWDTSPGILAVQSYLKDNGHREFAAFDPHVTSERGMEGGVYGGAFNYLNIEKFLDAVRAAPWARPEYVQIFIRDEDEDIFTERLIPRLPGPVYAPPPPPMNEEQQKRFKQAVKDGLI